MRFVIITGMSGAGRGTALRVLEDAGYFCVDNLPISLISKFSELLYSGKNDVQKVALGIDIRSGQGLEEMQETLEGLDQAGIKYEILYLDATDEVLIKRYKETRRNHPLAGIGRVAEGIEEERERLKYLKKKADYIIETSNLLTRELKVELDKIFVENKEFKNLVLTILSFGFKNEIPADADLVFDVRFLPNPYYYQELRSFSGNDKEIQDFVMNFEAAHIFLNKLVDMVEFLLPQYVEEGKNQLVIAIGCTGGKHRSVTLANKLYDHLCEDVSYMVKKEHRDIQKETLIKGH